MKKRFKWVRTAIKGVEDPANVTRHLARGWRPAKKRAPTASINPTNILDPELGITRLWGLALYEMPEENARELDEIRDEKVRALTAATVTAFLISDEQNTFDTRWEPTKVTPEFISKLPERLSGELAEQAQCYIEDFLRHRYKHSGSFRECLDEINLLRARMRRRLWTEDDLRRGYPSRS